MSINCPIHFEKDLHIPILYVSFYLILKLWQNKKDLKFVWNDVFFSAVSCKKDIIFGPSYFVRALVKYLKSHKRKLFKTHSEQRNQ